VVLHQSGKKFAIIDCHQTDHFMKTLFLFLCLFSLSMVHAQLKTSTQNQCGPFTIDVLDGKLNGMKANVSFPEAKKNLPCYTSIEGEDSSKCGGLISFKDKDVYFYTGRNYVEIREKFKGKLSVPLMGAARNSLFKWLGNPAMKDTNWDAFQTSYGVLILYYNKANKVNKIQFSTETTSSINLCE
jgi:hypothetical protein